MNRLLGRALILLIKFYSKVLSPILPGSCRYTPSCSRYTAEAIRKWGPFTGSWIGLKRILSCNPWGGSGYDPVPDPQKIKWYDLI